MGNHDVFNIADARAWCAEYQQNAIQKRITQLVGVYGSVRAVGRALRIDHAYLHRLRKGSKKSPSDSVLRKLGLAV